MQRAHKFAEKNIELLTLALLGVVLLAPSARSGGSDRRSAPDHVPPKRSSQIQSGFGINSNLPPIRICRGTGGGGRACSMRA